MLSSRRSTGARYGEGREVASIRYQPGVRERGGGGEKGGGVADGEYSSTPRVAGNETMGVHNPFCNVARRQGVR